MKLQKKSPKVGYFSKIEEMIITALAAKRPKRQTSVHVR